MYHPTKKNNLLRELVDAGGTKTIDKLPLHRKFWQLQQKLQWIQRVDAPDIVLPIIGGDGAYFEKTFAWRRDDTRLFDGSRLNQLLTKGFIKSNGKPVSFYHPDGSSYMWQRLDAEPHDAEQRLLDVNNIFPVSPSMTPPSTVPPVAATASSSATVFPAASPSSPAAMSSAAAITPPFVAPLFVAPLFVAPPHAAAPLAAPSDRPSGAVPAAQGARSGARESHASRP